MAGTANDEHPAAYTLRRDIGPFPAGTPAEIIREHPNGAVGVLVNGNAFTVRKDDLAPGGSAACPRGCIDTDGCGCEWNVSRPPPSAASVYEKEITHAF